MQINLHGKVAVGVRREDKPPLLRVQSAERCYLSVFGMMEKWKEVGRGIIR